MRVEVINTGTEILLGQVVNTHLAYLGEQLFPIGLRIQRQTCIPDGDAIADMLQEAFPRADVLLITGGLGPTSDDITREVISGMFGLSMTLDEEIVERIKVLFRMRGKEMPESNARQAMIPEGAIVLDNPHGTAPGLYFPAMEGRNPHMFLMPGPPRELKPMFSEIVLPQLTQMVAEQRGQAPSYRNFRVLNVGESHLAEVMEKPLLALGDVELGYCARLGEVDVRVIARTEVLDRAESLIREHFPEDLVNTDNRSLEKTVIDLLCERGEWVTTAESCTGGFIAHSLTSVSGSSGAFGRGYVTYANEAKTEMLGVPADLIAEHGAVSEPVARAMAEGARDRSGADHAISVTGIAGPTGGTDAKPVGAVYIGLASKGRETFVESYRFHGDRQSFKLRTTRQAMDLLRRSILGYELGESLL